MLKEDKKYYLKAFLFAFGIALIIFLPLIIKFKGIFMYYGDYTIQHIPFNMLCVKEVHKGNYGWNWSCDLGVSFINSFGGIISLPTFWIMALFPAKAVPYLIGPVSALKIGLCSLTSFAYLKRFIKNKDCALIGALLYSFSGYTFYNLVFYSFQDMMYVFPLLLISLEEAVINKRRIIFCLTAALCSIMNIYFFMGQCIFLVIYFIIRLKQSKEFRIGVKDFFCLAFESITALMISGIIFVPSLISNLSNPRAGNFLTGIDFMFFNEGINYGVLIESLFFPSEMMPTLVFFSMADMGYPSLGAYLPLFSMAGVIAFVKNSKKEKWIKSIILIFLLIMFVPGLSSAFSLFNNFYNTRWLYMPILICCLATSYTLENDECDIKDGFKWNAIIVTIISVLLLMYPVRDNLDITYADGTVVHVDETRPHFMKTMPIKTLYILVPAVVFLIALYFILKYKDKISKKKFLNISLIGVICSSIIIGHINMYRANQEEGRENELIIKTFNNPLEIEDDEFYRIISEVYYAGLGTINDIGSPQSFISIVPTSTFEIFDTIGKGRGNMSEEWQECYAWYALTNSKYLVIYDYEDKKEYVDMFYKGYNYYKSQGDMDILINENVMPVGYTYDEYTLYENGMHRLNVISDYESYYITDKIMVASVLLTPEQAEKYSNVLTETKEEEMEDTDFTFERFEKDSAERRASAIAEFNIDEKGNFTAKTNYTEDELVVFSIPYDDGWSCKINGVPAEIDKVNGGFMAVYVEAGENELSFEYNTPGLKEGALLSGAGVVLLIIWIAAWHFVGKKKKVAIAAADSEEKAE